MNGSPGNAVNEWTNTLGALLPGPTSTPPSGLAALAKPALHPFAFSNKGDELTVTSNNSRGQAGSVVATPAGVMLSKQTCLIRCLSQASCFAAPSPFGSPPILDSRHRARLSSSPR